MTQAAPPNRSVAAFGLLLAFGAPALALAGTHGLPGPPAYAAAGLLTLTPWLTLAWIRLVERRGLASIGLRRPGWATLAGGVAGVAVNLGISLGVGRLNAWLGWHETQSAMMTRLLQGPGWLLVLLLGNGALLTEICFRGYGLERLSDILGGRRAWAMAVQLCLTTALFAGSRGIAHGLIWLVDDIAFSLFYLWRRDLAACLIAHLIPNTTAALLVALGVAH